MTDREIAEPNTILRAIVGSELYGVMLGDTSDRDELGICIEPPEYVVGLKRFEQWVYRDAADGERSSSGNLDLTIYSLRKWCSLALKGNPTALQLLFIPEKFRLDSCFYGDALQELAWAFASRQAGKAFLGYMTAQRQRLMGERGQMRVKRPELVEEHGYDTKYAAHILRLGYQGVEFLTTGKMTFPLSERERMFIVGTRRGVLDFDDVLNISGKLLHEIEELLTSSPLPEKPDYDAVNEFLVQTYRSWWSE